MEGITLGDISGWVTFLIGFVGALGAFWVLIQKGIKSAIKPDLDEIKEIGTETAMCNASNFIKNFLSDLDRDMEMSPIEYEAFYHNLKIYERYEGNGFIHNWIDRLKAEGKFNKDIDIEQK